MKMRKQMPILDMPLNAEERALNGIAVRLDRIIELLEIVIQEKPEVEITPEVILTSETPAEPIVEYDFYNMTKKEIIDILDKKNITYDSRATKATLIELLK